LHRRRRRRRRRRRGRRGRRNGLKRSTGCNATGAPPFLLILTVAGDKG
jgi:hypothetical protein